jgi:peptide/nickel transport system substrate-binding protein
MNARGPFSDLYERMLRGQVSRRGFLERALALGMALPVAQAILVSTAGAQQASPEASPVASAGVRPDSGTDGQTRGAGGELKLLQWQAPTTLSLHESGSFKDMLAAALVTEPLINFLPDATPVPNLVKEIPSFENGLLAADLMSVTYNLLEGVVWSDGEPFTANDVAFTHKWITDPANGSVNSALYAPIASVDVIDDLTVRLNFSSPQIGWYSFFASTVNGAIYPEHFFTDGTASNDAFRQQPIGTGPYVVQSFTPNDQVIYAINDNYREPNKPYFATVNLKGGGDAATAAQAVLQTGEYDFAWNLQVEPEVLNQFTESGKGDLVITPGNSVEWVAFNFSDPNKTVDDQRSYWQQPHPFLSDPAVRQALALGVDRQSISDQLYFGSEGEPPTSNVLLGVPAYTSPNTTWEYNIDKGNQILDDAGWVLDGKTRSKDGIELKLSYSTSINSVRQKTQAVIQQGWEALGFEVNLLQIDAGIFFDTAPGNDQNLYHMYWDCHEYAFSPAGPFPLSYMLRWVSHNGENIPQKENNWSQINEGRYNNPEYDALYDQAAAETDPAKVNELFIQMNDIIINDVVLIPLVQRAAEKYALAKSLRKENIAGGPFESLYWNIVNWNKAE